MNNQSINQYQEFSKYYYNNELKVFCGLVDEVKDQNIEDALKKLYECAFTKLICMKFNILKNKLNTVAMLKELKNIFIDNDASEELTVAFLKLIEDKMCDINVNQWLQLVKKKHSEKFEEYYNIMYNAVREWVKESVSAFDVEDWEWDEENHLLTIFNGEDTERFFAQLTDEGLVVTKTLCISESDESEEEISVPSTSEDDEEVCKKVPRRQLSTPARRKGESFTSEDAPAAKEPRRQLSTPARRKKEPITETMEEAYHNFFCDNSLEFKVSCMVNPKLMNFIKDGSGIIESDYFVCPDCDPIWTGRECKCGANFPGFDNVPDEDWIEAFVERCQEDDGVALQNEIQKQEDLEIISFLQKCEDLMFEDKIYCEVGEHYVEPEDHWDTVLDEPFADCMNCCSIKELRELGVWHEDEEIQVNVNES